MTRHIIAASLLVALSPVALSAQQLDVPFDTYCPPNAEAACFGVATVMGLDPNGDGFLALRSGPGSGYRMLAKLPNGLKVNHYGTEGSWSKLGVESGGREILGWAHRNWLGNFIP